MNGAGESTALDFALKFVGDDRKDANVNVNVLVGNNHHRLVNSQ